MEVGGEVDVQTHEEEATNLHEQEGEEHLPYYANERVQLPDQLEHGMQEQDDEENQQEDDKEEFPLEENVLVKIYTAIFYMYYSWTMVPIRAVSSNLSHEQIPICQL